MSTTGALVLVPSWLDDSVPVEGVLAAGVLARIRGLRAFVAEDAKSARRFLAACAHPVPLREIAMSVLDEHTPPAAVPALLDPVRRGEDLGLLSEAGLPAVADPGALLVAAAHAEGIAVVPLPGPSSILLALAASGLEGQRFRFLGYLPTKPAERRERILEIEARSARERETQVFIETPYRNDALLADLLAHCKPATHLAVASGLTGPSERVQSRSVGQWRGLAGGIGKVPSVFLILAGRQRIPGQAR